MHTWLAKQPLSFLHTTNPTSISTRKKRSTTQNPPHRKNDTNTGNALHLSLHTSHPSTLTHHSAYTYTHQITSHHRLDLKNDNEPSSPFHHIKDPPSPPSHENQQSRPNSGTQFSPNSSELRQTQTLAVWRNTSIDRKGSRTLMIRLGRLVLAVAADMVVGAPGYELGLERSTSTNTSTKRVEFRSGYRGLMEKVR
jgi:hypothetical protein